MNMYPAYTLRDVMDEYASTFLTLLAEGYRIKNRNYHMLAVISLLAYMKPEQRRELMTNLEWAGKDPNAILKTSDDYSGIEKLRGILNGKS